MKHWPALPVTMAALAVCLAACSPPPTPRPDGSGTIECTQVQVSAQIAGRILTLLPQEGMTVKKGELVATLDPADYELKRDELRAIVAQAQAQFDLLQAGAREEDMQRAREQVREAKAAAVSAAADLMRTEKLLAGGIATRQQLDDTQALAERTAATVAAAEQVLARLEHGNRKEEIRMAQAKVDQTQAQLAQVEKAIGYCTVTAPTDGMVTTRNREDGEYVNPGMPLVTLSRLDDVWLAVCIPETRLTRVKLGRPAWVKVDGDAQLHEGMIAFVAPEAEFTPRNVQTPEERAKLVFRVKIALPNPDGVFKPGMPADGYLDPPSPSPGVATPPPPTKTAAQAQPGTCHCRHRPAGEKPTP
ncbi:MAG: hypothetical protein A3K19_04485 [Lentisphaerae bacterium RIFOXYB12_FULL_65_16]|nr:MAG: hypothetical protein A3K19_04485 [Lentisphaerae bacterium RIFOXYB12_FULL_65_16]